MTRCPTCGQDKDHRASNQMTSVYIEVPIELLPAVSWSLTVGETRSMCSSEHKVRESYAALNKTVKGLVPEAISCFEEYKWHGVCERIKSGENLKAKAVAKHKYDSPWQDIEGYYAVIVDQTDEVVLQTGFMNPDLTDEATAKRHAESIQDIFDQLAPMEPTMSPKAV